MFSIENLAWATSNAPGYAVADLPVCERGPNGGRIMWFPPYNLTFSDSSTASWNPTSFLGRPEPIHTYKNTTRSGSISWTIVVDHPSVLNTLVRKQLEKLSPGETDSIINSFFAGCVKYDLYDLAAKFNTIPVNLLYEYQQLLSNPRLTDEQKYATLNEIPTNQAQSTGGADDPTVAETGKGKTNDTNGGNSGSKTNVVSDISTEMDKQELTEWEGYAFYFDNDYPFGYGSWETTVPTNQNYEYWYNVYTGTGRKSVYNSNAAPQKVQPYKVVNTRTGALAPDGTVFTKSEVIPFFENVVVGNFQEIKNKLLPKLKEILVDKKGSVTIELQGSASAPASVEYNSSLSKRRNDSVKKWFLAQTLGDKKMSEFLDKTLKFKFVSSGEQFIIPKTNNGNGKGVNCTNNIVDLNLGYVTSNSQWYSVPAMVCRRVGIERITIETPKPPPPPEPIVEPIPEPKPEPKPVIEKYRCVNGQCIRDDVNGTFTGLTDCQNNCGTAPITDPAPVVNPKPIDIPKKIKEGISKKVLRHLFSECDYFDIIKETDPLVYASIKDKIKYNRINKLELLVKNA
jgi:outer membrane protein OmpA-like peptidoglycan-associated protein